ncbi:MAG: hypothetical protein J6O00_11230 [Clostridiales bacterium]|nr:hypothetical protein [Clostridiales bacterium]
MEPYNNNKPFIQMKLDGSLLDRLVEAGIPLTRALQYFRDNPEGSALETLKTAAEDRIPFYGNYRNGGDWSDYVKEAALMFMPWQIRAYRKPSTFKPEPQRKYYANNEPIDRHKLFTDSEHPGIIESVPEVGDAGRMSGGSGYYEVDPNKFIQDEQRLAQMSIDAANLVPTRYESVGDIQLSNKRHYSYGELIKKQEAVKEQIDKFNYKHGWIRNFDRDPLTPDEHKKLIKLQNQLNELDIEIGLNDYKAAIDNTYGPYYDDLNPYYTGYEQSRAYDTFNTRKDISKIK